MSTTFPPPRFCNGAIFLIMQPQIGDTVGGISRLKLGFIICGRVKMRVRGNELAHPFKNKQKMNNRPG